MKANELSWPVPACCTGDDDCICSPTERAARGWAFGGLMPAMTPDQRRYLEEQILRVEGYGLRDVEGATDKELAYTVLCAWTDFARDKGLL